MLRKLARQVHFSVYIMTKVSYRLMTLVFRRILRKEPPRLSTARRTMSAFFDWDSIQFYRGDLRLEHYAGLDDEHLVYELAELSSRENSLRYCALRTFHFCAGFSR